MYSKKISVFYKTSSNDFKRNLIRIIEIHPKVWNETKQVDDEWEIIRKEMSGMGTIKHLKAIWSTLRSLYFQKIFIRTIECNREAPQWPFFHDMTFMYASVKEDIKEKLGGISPPLFRRSPDQTLPCPCCEYFDESDSKSETQKVDEIIEEIKLEEEMATVSSETVLKNDNTYEYIDENEYIDEKLEINTNSKWENGEQSLQTQHYETTLIDLQIQDANFNEVKEQDELKTESASFDPSSEIPQTQDNDVNEIDTSLQKNKDPLAVKWLRVSQERESSNIQMLETRLEKDDKDSFNFDEEISINFKSENEDSSEFQPNQKNPLDLPSENVKKEETFDEIIEVMKDDETESPSPHNKTDDNHTSINMPFPVHLIKTSNAVVQCQGKKDTSSVQEKKLAYIRSGNMKFIVEKFKTANQSQYRTIKWLELIEAVKANPIIYDTSLQTNKKIVSDAWKRISMQLLGRLCVGSIKDRWDWITNQYLMELLYERYYTGREKSCWEFFKNMEFLRPFMQGKINQSKLINLHLKMKEKNQEIPSKKKPTSKSEILNVQLDPKIYSKMRETVKKNQETSSKKRPASKSEILNIQLDPKIFSKMRETVKNSQESPSKNAPESNPERLNVDPLSKTYGKQPEPKNQESSLKNAPESNLERLNFSKTYSRQPKPKIQTPRPVVVPVKLSVLQNPTVKIDLPNDECKNLKTNCTIEEYLPATKKGKLSTDFEQRLPSPTNIPKEPLSPPIFPDNEFVPSTEEPSPDPLQLQHNEKSLAAYMATKKQTVATYQSTGNKQLPSWLKKYPNIKITPVPKKLIPFKHTFVQKSVPETQTQPSQYTGRPIVSNSIFLNRSVTMTPLSGGVTSAIKDLTRNQGIPINTRIEEVKVKTPLKVIKVKKLCKILPVETQKYIVPPQKVHYHPPTCASKLELSGNENKDAEIEHQNTGRRKSNKDDANVISCVDDEQIKIEKI